MGPVVGGVVDRVGHPFLGEGTYEGYESAVGGRWSCWGGRLRGHGGTTERSKRRDWKARWRLVVFLRLVTSVSVGRFGYTQLKMTVLPFIKIEIWDRHKGCTRIIQEMVD